MPIKRCIWMVVADASQARIFSTEGSRQGKLSELAEESLKNSELHRHARDVGSDRPGRTVESIGSVRHAADAGVDLHREEKDRFARRIAAHLEERARQNRFDAVILIAPPRSLGALRPALGPETHRRLIREIDKDLTKLSLTDLTTTLQATIPLQPALARAPR
mgnify:FL=1